ncbi:IS5/IS1182 family transposase, partial [Staphylococcus sp. SQ8-PEA]|nr:IS5/IS1182 family transposase [Staphylococcus marylandisciuri]
LNIRKVVAQRANYSQNNSKKGNFCIITIEIALFSLIKDLYVPASFSLVKDLYVPAHRLYI